MTRMVTDAHGFFSGAKGARQGGTPSRPTMPPREMLFYAFCRLQAMTQNLRNLRNLRFPLSGLNSYLCGFALPPWRSEIRAHPQIRAQRTTEDTEKAQKTQKGALAKASLQGGMLFRPACFAPFAFFAALRYPTPVPSPRAGRRARGGVQQRQSA